MPLTNTRSDVLSADLTWQPSLLDPVEEPGFDAEFMRAERVELDREAWVDYVPGWVRGAATMFEDIVRCAPWTHRDVPMYGRMVAEPRLLAWYGAALDDPDSWCGLIVDGYHVHDAALRVAIAAKPAGKMLLVTDAMPPVGGAREDFSLYGVAMTCRDGKCTTADGTLAGSALDMASAVRNTVQRLGLPLAEACRMASTYPAEFLGLGGELGRIAPGYRADLAWLDPQLQVQGTWIAGRT